MPRKKKSARKAPSRKVAVGLVRVSSSKQEFSAKDQEIHIRRWADEAGYELIETFVDESVSGSRLDRPGLNALFSFLAASPEKGVVVSWKRNRLLRKRDPRIGIVLNHRVEELGWRCHFLAGYQRSGNVVLDTIADVMEHPEGGEYLANLSRDALRGSCNRIEAGGIFGGVVPYGYAKQYIAPDGRTRIVKRGERHARGYGEEGQWVPGDPVEVRVVERIFRRYATGQQSFIRIAQDLNTEGVPGPGGRTWTRYNVRGIVANPTYKGQLVWNRCSTSEYFRRQDGQLKPLLEEEGGRHVNSEADWIKIDDHHEGLVAVDVWEQANRLLAARGKARGGARNVKRCYPLRGLVTCGNCGGPMVGELTGCKKYRYPKYVCATWGANRACHRFAIRQERLEETILLKLQEQLGAGRDLEALQDELMAAYRRRLEDDAPVWDHHALAHEASQLERRVEQATRNLSLLHGVAAKGLAKQINEMAARLEELQGQLATPQEDPREEAERVVGKAISLLEELGSLRESASPERLRTLFVATVDRVELKFGRRKAKVRSRNYLESGRVVLRAWTEPLSTRSDPIQLGPEDRVL